MPRRRGRRAATIAACVAAAVIGAAVIWHYLPKGLAVEARRRAHRQRRQRRLH
ncbi:hypothetical protein LP420_13655 [Massilia sp. B-10]|nr:hypothetical protein LP420_13655 [Massilia sp. B-10]